MSVKNAPSLLQHFTCFNALPVFDKKIKTAPKTGVPFLAMYWSSTTAYKKGKPSDVEQFYCRNKAAVGILCRSECPSQHSLHSFCNKCSMTLLSADSARAMKYRFKAKKIKHRQFVLTPSFAKNWHRQSEMSLISLIKLGADSHNNVLYVSLNK